MPAVIRVSDEDRRAADAKRRWEWVAANRERARATSRRHYARNREAILAKQRAQRAEDPTRSRAASKAWRERNPDKVKSGWAAWREAHPERAAQWRVENPEAVYEGIRAWQKANPEKVAEYAVRRRARKHGAQGTHTAAEWQAVLGVFGRVCLGCLRPEGEVRLTRDHVVPLAKGGRDDVSNLQPLCRPCNSRKGLADTDFRVGVA